MIELVGHQRAAVGEKEEGTAGRHDARPLVKARRGAGGCDGRRSGPEVQEEKAGGVFVWQGHDEMNELPFDPFPWLGGLQTNGQRASVEYSLKIDATGGKGGEVLI